MVRILLVSALFLSAACSASSGKRGAPIGPVERSSTAEASTQGEGKPPGGAGTPAVEPEPEPEPILSQVDLTWYDRADALADRQTIAQAFERRGYRPPSEAYLLIGRISSIAGHPAFTWFSLGDTGFVQSADSFWPASMVKLIAAVGALETLHEHGLDGSSKISFTDGRGEYRGSASRLYSSALTHSNNVAYDRLMKIAGFDAINDRILSPENSFPFMTMQRAYDGQNDESLRVSPEITYEDRELRGTIPRRESEAINEQCPDEGNCATLFEMLHFLARVVLHDELEEADRFNLHPYDKRALIRYLEQAPTRIGPGIEEALKHPVTIYNKGGRVPDLVANDHALVVDQVNGRRYLVAASIAEEGGKDETKARIAELVRRGMEAVAFEMERGLPVSRDAGIPIEISWRNEPEAGGQAEIDVASSGDLSSLIVYEGHDEVARSGGELLKIERALPGEEPRVYTAIARKGKLIVGYRSIGLVTR